MGRTNAQASEKVFGLTTGGLIAACNISGSRNCQGYAQLVGYFTTDASTIAGSGLAVRQSVDGGVNWDYVSASDKVGPSGSVACIVDIIGDAVRVDVTMGADDASNLRFGFWLRPI